MTTSRLHYRIQAKICLTGLLLGFRVYVPDRDKTQVATSISEIAQEFEVEYIDAEDIGDISQLIYECENIPAFLCEHYVKFNEVQEIDVMWIVPKYLDRVYNAFEIVCDERNKAQVVRIVFEHLKKQHRNFA